MRFEPDIGRAPWDVALAAQPAALQQDWCYGEAMAALGAGVRRVGILDGNTLVGLAQFTTRKVAGLVSMALCTRGPVWLEDVDPAGKAAAYKGLRDHLGLRQPRLVMLSPDETEAIGTERLSRVMTGYSTVLVDLTQDLESLRAGLDGKWRNRLVSAEKSSLKVSPNGTKLAQYRWLLETEDGQRAERGYRATPASLVPAFVEARQDKRSLLILRADLGRQKAAAMLFLVHGCAATYHMGWSSPEGRQAGAHNLLMWNAFEALQARGVRQLDLGGVNTSKPGAGLARFKIGTGGEVVTLAGTYL